MIRFALLVSFTALLAACSSKPAPDLYVLSTPDVPAARPCGTPKGPLSIERPHAREEYDSKRFAVRQGDHRLTYYTGAAWASPLPEQIQAMLAELFAASTDAAADETAPGTRLQLVIQEAAVTPAEFPVVHVRMSGRWQTAGGKTLARFTTDRRETAAANHMPDIVAAYHATLTKAAQDMAHALAPRCRAR